MLLQVNAVLGPATRTHTIYEHIEVVVHPLGVHLTEAVATPFWVGNCCSPLCNQHGSGSIAKCSLALAIQGLCMSSWSLTT